jgi:hypothetical protein
MTSSLTKLLTVLCALASPFADEPKRLSLADAERDVRAFVYADMPTMSPAEKFPLKEITTDDVWNRLHVQLFQVTEGVRAYETLVIAGERVRYIGHGFGGFGVRSVVVADLDGDGRPELVYTYSCGSGMHRARLAVYDVLAKEPKEFLASEAYYAENDWMLERVDERTVRVVLGKTVVGTVVFDREAKVPVSLKLDASLPQTIRGKIHAYGA